MVDQIAEHVEVLLVTSTDEISTAGTRRTPSSAARVGSASAPRRPCRGRSARAVRRRRRPLPPPPRGSRPRQNGTSGFGGRTSGGRRSGDESVVATGPRRRPGRSDRCAARERAGLPRRHAAPITCLGRPALCASGRTDLCQPSPPPSLPSFCRHNHLVQNCPICSKEQAIDLRPIVTSSAPRTGSPADRAGLEPAAHRIGARASGGNSAGSPCGGSPAAPTTAITPRS